MERRRQGWALGLVLLLGLGGCGADQAVSAGGTPSAAASGFGATQAAEVLAAFDEGDSAASTAGDPDALARFETAPALDASLAGVRRADYHKRTQPAFQHVDPKFALPGTDPRCFLVSATLRITGEESTYVDFSQFVRTPVGDWKLSHHVQVSREAVPAIGDLSASPAVPSAEAVGERSRKAIATELLARTIATDRADTSLVASSPLLDQQFAAGWTIYQQQMAAARMTVERTMQSAEWSACAARTPGGTLALLTMYVTDRVAPAAGNRAPVVLPAESPDMIALGERDGVRGPAVSVSRVEVFLLLVPDAEGSPARVLGLSDAPTKVTTS
ncbi:hypothetical protein [Plantactinospora sp. B24E8]|uniref:hypothetical protein n=1 Tax=Plantactinospora sp. B24E8 TaxID=3153567 RepID=UPI00325E9F09